MMFTDRKDAGQKLGKLMDSYIGCNGIVMAIPKGGVEVGFYVAKQLRLPLSLIIVRKLPMPDNPEAGFGAIAEDGSTFIIREFYDWIPSQVIKKIIKEQKLELKRRINVLRKGMPLPDVEDKVAILVDDGIAMGSTVQAAIMLCRNKKAKKVVVASPVAGPQATLELAKVADEVVIMEKPSFFRAVAESYRNWYDVPDEEVMGFVEKCEHLQTGTNLDGSS
jgi:putative phosphoribosyl transferase